MNPGSSPKNASDQTPQAVTTRLESMHITSGGYPDGCVDMGSGGLRKSEGMHHRGHHFKGGHGRFKGHHGHHHHHHGRSRSPYPAELQQDDGVFAKWRKHFIGDRGHGWHHHGERANWKGRPRADVLATPEAYVLTAEIPGMKWENIAVQFQVEEQSLLPVVVIEGERKPPLQEEAAITLLQERLFGPFHRRFVFPADAAHVAADIKHTDGVLTVTVPRRQKEQPSAPVQLKGGDVRMEGPESPLK